MSTITVTNGNDSGPGSLRAALAAASAGDIINFAPLVRVIDLASTLVISKNVTIEGAQPGSSVPDVTINGGGSASDFSDFVINAGVNATLDGLVIANGHASGSTGANGGIVGVAGGAGGAAAGGIFDAGSLTLTNSLLENDTATGGAGGRGGQYAGGGGGGSAAGAIYVTNTGALTLAASDRFSGNTATGGAGGAGGYGVAGMAAPQGGAGGISSLNGGAGSAGGYYPRGGAGGQPGRPGGYGQDIVFGFGPGGGGGGGNAFADVGGAGAISGPVTLLVTNNSDDINTAGSLRYELTRASSGDIIRFASDVTLIDLSSSLVISTNVTIEGAQPGSSAPGVIINGGGSASNFADFMIDTGVSATLDGLIIVNGHATGSAGATGGSSGVTGDTGHGAAGGIFDAGSLTLTNSLLENDTATGGAGGRGGQYAGGGGGGSAAGAIYVTNTGALTLAASDRFSGNTATGGAGGAGGYGVAGMAAPQGGAGGISSLNGGAGSAGGYYPRGGAGGQPGQPGGYGQDIVFGFGPGGGGGGGNAFADVGGAGAISGPVTLLVTNNSDDINTAGSLRYELARASSGDIIEFASNVTSIDLSSSLVIATNITIEGAQAGSTTPGVTINGGGSASEFSDFVIDAGVNATLDGLVIANGHATGTAGADGGSTGVTGGAGGGAAGGIFDAGLLTLTNSLLQNDTATGGVGGTGGQYAGGGAGGSAAGAIYVTGTGTLTLATSDEFGGNSAKGGAGGGGGYGSFNQFGGSGGAGGISGVNGGLGSPGNYGLGGGAGGQPGQPGGYGPPDGALGQGPGGGGGGGTAFGDFGGAGAISGPVTLLVTNNSDNISTVGSLRYELAQAKAGDIIKFASDVTTIDLSSSLVIATNVTIEGAQPGSSAPGVTSNGGGSGSNFSDFTINAGVNATIDGLVIANGHATGTAGADGGSTGMTGGTGGGAAGGIFDAGSLMLTNSLLQNDTATGGAGGTGGEYAGGGAGGSAAGGIYVTGTGTLTLATSDQFSGNSAVGGAGGDGGYGSLFPFGGSGGAGGISGVNGGIGSPGNYVLGGGAGGQPGQPGGYGPSNGTLGRGPGGGGGGGTAFADVGGAGTIIPCYCPGTLIRTARGPRPVESLRVGDTVTTASGAERPIKWIGRRGYGGRFIIGRKDILPICIKAGALDDNVPERELWISPHHAMYLDGVLIEAKDLVNGISIVQAERVDSVEYLHIELESHDVIIAEGALSESYVDDDNRFMFHNAHEYRDDHPVPATASVARYCAPRIDHGYELEAIRHRLALRAGSWRQQAVSSAGELRGSIDRLTPCAIEGWAQDGEHPEAPVCLDIYVDGQLVGQTLANRYREDLRRAGLGSGCHAFEFVPPAGVSLEPGNVEVRRAIDGRPLELATDAERAVA